MNDELYYYGEEEIKQTKETKETPQEHLTRMLYLRNFDTPKKINELKDEIDVLRSAVEALAEREKIGRMDSVGAINTER